MSDKRNQIGVEPIYDATVLGWGKMLLLGIQHTFAMSGATILVPILIAGFFVAAGLGAPTAGLTVATTLFCAGAGTLLFHVLTKLKVPAFLGSSFAFLGGFATVANLNTGIYATMDANTKAAYACGGVIVAGALYLVLALIVKAVGVERMMRFLPPVVTGPVIACIGLTLAPSAISNCKTNWFLAIVAIVIMVGVQQWGKGMMKIVPILMAFVGAYVVAIVMNLLGFTNADGSAILDFSGIAAAGVVAPPPFQLPKFGITPILGMAPIAIASMMEHIGDMSAISATTERDLIEDPGLHRTLLGDGLATILAGAIGGPANTTYGENTGVLNMTKVYDPKVIRIAAVIAVLVSFLPKISAVIATMPAAIIGGISFILYGMITAIGFRNVKENNVDLGKQRNVIIIAVIMVAGLGFTDGITFHIGETAITLTGLAIAAILGIAFNALLPGNDYVYGENAVGDQNQGIHNPY